MHRTAVKKVVFENVLDANDTLARTNREELDRAGTYTINMMSSPGAGKTALLERTLERLRGKLRLGVLEGDVQTTLDADRLARFHIPLVQVNTDPGFGGECLLDANMVRSSSVVLPAPGALMKFTTVTPLRSKSSRFARAIVLFASSASSTTLTFVRCIRPPTWP